MKRTTGYICKKCGEPSPIGVGYKGTDPGTTDVLACPCGYSQYPDRRPPDYVALPGLDSYPGGREHVNKTLDGHSDFTPGWSYLAGGMESIRSPFLILANDDGRQLLVAEREDWVGELAPLIFDLTGEGLDVTDERAVLVYAAGVDSGDWVSYDDSDTGLLVPDDDSEDVHGSMATLLYVYRDVISPTALA